MNQSGGLSHAKIEEVIQRFATAYSDDEEEQEQTRHPLSLSKQMKYEFKMAFKVVAGKGEDALPYEKLYSLFQALGYTFQDSDIDRLIEQCYQDQNGNFSFESLLDAFDAWYVSQISTDELKATFLNVAGADFHAREAFTTAFEVVAVQGSTFISEAKLEDLLLELPRPLRALNCNFERKDHQIIKEAARLDSNGNYTLEALLDAFDVWYTRELQADEASPRVFIEYDKLEAYVREILNLPPDIDPDIVTQAARQLAEEISSDPHGTVSFKDFVEVFRYKL